MLLVIVPMLAASASAYSLGAMHAPHLLRGGSRAADAVTMSAYDYTLPDLSGSPVDLSEYKGKVALLVNVASK